MPNKIIHAHLTTLEYTKAGFVFHVYTHLPQHPGESGFDADAKYEMTASIIARIKQMTEKTTFVVHWSDDPNRRQAMSTEA